MAYFPPTGSVVAFQSDPTKLQINASVSGTAGASIIGLTPVAVTNTPNVNAAGSVASFPQGTIVSSLVSTVPSSVIVGASIFGLAPVGLRFTDGTALNQSAGNLMVNVGNLAIGSFGNTDAVSSALTSGLDFSENFLWNSGGGVWQRAPGNSSVGALVSTGQTSVISVPQGSVAVAIISGSVAVATGNSSVMLLNGANTIGSVTTLQGTNPWIITGSVQGSFSPAANQSVSGTVNIAGNPSVSGTVATTQQGTWISSIVNTVPSSVIVGASIFGLAPAGTAVLGSVAALQGTSPWNIAGSVAATITNTNVNVSGSVVASGTVVATQLAGSIMATSATVNMSNSSVMLLNGANVIGSVTALQGTNPWLMTFSNSSIFAVQSGTTISSVINSIPSSLLTGNYAQRNDAVASFLGGNLTWNPVASDSAGRLVIKPFSPEESTFHYTGSVVSGSVTLIKASAIGKKNYITDYQIANTGATTTLVTFQGGDTSVVAYTIAPTGGGSNALFQAPPNSNASQDLAFKMATATSILYLTVNGFQAP